MGALYRDIKLYESAINSFKDESLIAQTSPALEELKEQKKNLLKEYNEKRAEITKDWQKLEADIFTPHIPVIHKTNEEMQKTEQDRIEKLTRKARIESLEKTLTQLIDQNKKVTGTQDTQCKQGITKKVGDNLRSNLEKKKGGLSTWGITKGRSSRTSHDTATQGVGH
jgi:flagellar motility protein MotE (MotC chaperone)